MQPSLTLTAPLPKRLMAWAAERFPVPNLLVSALFFACALVCGRHAGTAGPITLRTADLLGVLAGVGFFLMLRVFDEHKDYDEDLANYPDRVLSRGLISLDHLKLVGLAAMIVQLMASISADGGVGPATFGWLVVITYSLLMLKEFFIHDWLKPRLVLYAASHMLVTPLAMFWFFIMGSGAAKAAGSLLWLISLSFSAGSAFELARKMRGPEEERPEVDSYTKQLGLKGSATALAFALAVVAASELMLLKSLNTPWFTGLASVALLSLAPAVFALASFLRQPSAAGREKNEGMVGLLLLVSHAVPIVAVIQERGVQWHP